ncbi:MAG TPA: branched-chain amino acid ABC transporter substrate-binding protein [Solirubrobacterales bacterium]|nr:branched-chain amino acid ABC transporter substrate-binding protein [Solirubrobacterales bacterium]
MKGKAWIATAGAVAALALAPAGCGDSGEDESSGPFRLGLEAPLSGEQSVLGEGMLNGTRMAAKQLNEEGGILGRTVEVVPIDDAADPETGVAAAEAAIEEGLDGVVGPYNSGVGVETLPLYMDDDLVPIRLTSDPSTSELGFTLQPMTYQIAPVASRALTGWLGAKKVAIAYDPTENYPVSVSGELKESLEGSGVEVTAYEKVQPGRKSYADVVEKLEAGEPDAIYAAVYYPEGGLIAKAMNEGDGKAQCVADYASYDAGFVKTAGVAAARECPVVGVPAPDDFAESGEEVERYREQFGEAPGTWSPYTYDSAMFLADGIEEADGTGTGELTELLSQTSEWEGWTGEVAIDPETGNRDPATVVIAATDAKGDLHVDDEWAAAVGAPYE